MNLLNHLASHSDKREEMPQRLICPTSASLPQDGMLEYIGVETLADIVNDKNMTGVLTFRPDQQELLKCYVQYYKLFGSVPVVLSGVPGVEYNADFENNTWDCQRVAYHTVVNDLLELSRREGELKAERKNSSIYEKERSTYTRKSGDVKAFTAFDMPQGAQTLAHGKPDSEEPANAPEGEH